MVVTLESILRERTTSPRSASQQAEVRALGLSQAKARLQQWSDHHDNRPVSSGVIPQPPLWYTLAR
eukprot:SAG31_NODE_35525_length_322_cov_0.699552_1_plen_65_part_01